MSVYNPYHKTTDHFYLKLRSLANRIVGRFSRYPNVFLVNLQNSGSSAIDPILKEILWNRWYFLPPFGPEGSDVLNYIPHEPLYHWSHSPFATFSKFIGRKDCRFIYLHRDLRDVCVSWAHDTHNLKIFPDKNFKEILELTYKHNMPQAVEQAKLWLDSNCLVITFAEVKRDTTAVIRRILDYIGIGDISDVQLAQIVEKYSFEKVTGRKRGEDGPTVRSGYIYRKGTSGEWKQLFDAEMKSEFKSMYGQQLINLGYEKDLSW